MADSRDIIFQNDTISAAFPDNIDAQMKNKMNLEADG